MVGSQAFAYISSLSCIYWGGTIITSPKDIFKNSNNTVTCYSPTPTQGPTLSPTEAPTLSPTEVPTLSPSEAPTLSPTVAPTLSPTVAPTLSPTVAPIYLVILYLSLPIPYHTTSFFYSHQSPQLFIKIKTRNLTNHLTIIGSEISQARKFDHAL